MAGEGQVIDRLMVGDLVVENDIIARSGNLKQVNDNNYIHCFFNQLPVLMQKAGAGVPDGTDTQEQIMLIGGNTFEQININTQTLLSPVLGTNGLNVALDQTNTDGLEICCGISAINRGAFVVGTSPAFFAKLKFSIATVAGTDDCAFGFRKVEAYQALIDGYDEMAVLNSIAGNITIETILNGGTTSSTDTTNNWADAEIHELEVRVSAAGVVTYKIDGNAPLVTAAFTFDDAEVVVPFFYMVNNATLTGDLSLIEFECGLQ